MIVFSVAEIIEIHKKIVEKTGGTKEILNMGALEGAVLSVSASFGGVDLYESIYDKAAQLCYNLISDHAFRDGNKRVGAISLVRFLEVNGKKISYTQEDLVRLGLNVANGKMKPLDIKIWIIEHEKNISYSREKSKGKEPVR